MMSTVLPFNGSKNHKPVSEGIRNMVIFLAEKAVEEYIRESGQSTVNKKENIDIEMEKTIESSGTLL